MSSFEELYYNGNLIENAKEQVKEIDGAIDGFRDEIAKALSHKASVLESIKEMEEYQKILMWETIIN